MSTVPIRICWELLVYLVTQNYRKTVSACSVVLRLQLARFRKSPMLRITVHESPKQITLKLEGSLTGSWVMELEDCWRAASSNPTGRLLGLDLTEVDSVDCAGTYLLALLHNRGVQLIASGLVMTELVADIEGQWPLKSVKS
jgi:hypothetical protein